MAAYEPMTQAQFGFICDLVRDRELTSDLATIDEREVWHMNRGDASRLIDALKACPKRDDRKQTGTRVARNPVTGQLRELPTYTPAVVATRVVPNGTYTIDMGDDSHVTLQIVEATFVKDEQGVRQVSFLDGPDNELAYRGFAFIKQDGRVVVWKRFREGYGRQQAALQLLLTGDVAEAHRRFLDLAEAYALQSGSCMRCGKTLTVPASLHRGLGPVCADREDATSAEIASTPRFEGEARTILTQPSGPQIDDDAKPGNVVGPSIARMGTTLDPTLHGDTRGLCVHVGCDAPCTGHGVGRPGCPIYSCDEHSQERYDTIEADAEAFYAEPQELPF